MRSLHVNRLLLLILAVPGAVGSLLFANSTAAQMTPYGAQEMPPANNAARVQITEGPTLESFRNDEAIITWTSNNPGGADEHFGIVSYGTDRNQLNQTAKSHIRLNRNHPYTVFRVRVDGLKPGITYYYTVDSMGGDGTRDGLESTVYQLTTPADLPEP
jgi:phosphodiesterase/alkaline phosphatase D-like protein